MFSGMDFFVQLEVFVGERNAVPNSRTLKHFIKIHVKIFGKNVLMCMVDV